MMVVEMLVLMAALLIGPIALVVGVVWVLALRAGAKETRLVAAWRESLEQGPRVVLVRRSSFTSLRDED
jgi:hypothetical protein